MARWTDKIVGDWRVRVSDLDWHALEYLAFNMRPIDRQEIFGNLPTDNVLEFAAMVYQATAKNGYGWLGYWNERPVGALGLFEQWKGNWQIYSFGTDDYSKVVSSFLPKLFGGIEAAKHKGLRRLECRSIIHHTEAHRLLRVLGFVQEAVLRAYSKDGSDYAVFARIED